MSPDLDACFGITPHSLSQIQTSKDLFTCLEDHRLLGPYNMVFLPLLLMNVDRTDLKDLCDQYTENVRKKEYPLSLGRIGKTGK